LFLFNYFSNDGSVYTPVYQRVVTALMDHSNIMSLEDAEEHFSEFDGKLFTLRGRYTRMCCLRLTCAEHTKFDVQQIKCSLVGLKNKVY